jgi:tetratricopeptide (TPR) repeat protein
VQTPPPSVSQAAGAAHPAFLVTVGAGIVVVLTIVYQTVIKHIVERIIKKLDLFWKKLASTFRPPRPYRLPRGRNEFFISRDVELGEMREHFKQQSDTPLIQVISALGGMGKTSFALEYAHRYGSKHKGGIWWVDAARLFDDIADFLKAAGVTQDLTEKNIVSCLNDWCRKTTSWLIIFDNVDKLEDIQEYLPPSGRGSVIVTTRNGRLFKGRAARQIDLDPLDVESAVEFLTKRAKVEPNQSARDLIERLGRLPLALEQAASYMIENNISYAKYYELLGSYGLKLLDEGKPIDYNAVVTTTWQISMNKLSVAARQLLNLLSYMSHNDISLKIILDHADKLPDPLAGGCRDEIHLYAFVAELTKYSFIKHDGKEGLYSMHPLAQEVTRDDLRDDSTYIDAVIRILDNALPDKLFRREHFDTFHALLPHLEASLSYHRSYSGSSVDEVETANCYSKIGIGCRSDGLYDLALEWYEKALTIRVKALGPEHTDTASSYNNMGFTYEKLGDYSKALELYQRALAILEKRLGKDHPNTKKVVHNIARAQQPLASTPSPKRKPLFRRPPTPPRSL